MSAPDDSPTARLAEVQLERAALAALLPKPTPVVKRAGVTVDPDVLSLSVNDDDYQQGRTAAAIPTAVFEERVPRLVGEIRLSLGGMSMEGAIVAQDAAATLAVIVERAVAVRVLEVQLYAQDAVSFDVTPAIAALPITTLKLSAAQTALDGLATGVHRGITRLGLSGFETLPKRLLDGVALPNLRWVDADLPAELLAKVFKSKLAAKLEVLDLSRCGSSFDDGTLKKLLAARPKLAALVRLEIDPEYLSAKSLRALRSFCAEVIGVPDHDQLAWLDRRNARASARYDEVGE